MSRFSCYKKCNICLSTRLTVQLQNCIYRKPEIKTINRNFAMALKVRKFVKKILVRLIIAFCILFVGLAVYNILFEIRIYFINRSELSDIASVDQRSAEIFKKFLKEIESKTDWEVSIISGLRTKNEQIRLKKDNPQNASSNKSRHVLGRAIDINLYKRVGLRRQWLKKGNSKGEWYRTRVPAIAEKYQLLWGGRYRNYHDPVHFEIH